MVAIEAEDSDLIVHIVIEWVTFETDVISYIVVHHALLKIAVVVKNQQKGQEYQGKTQLLKVRDACGGCQSSGKA